jgi:hypothetical protein
MYCIYNLLISAAAAEIAGDGGANFLFGGIGGMVDQLFGAHQHAGSAETAVYGIVIEEGFLQRMQLFSFRQTFYCEDFLAVDLWSEDKTRIHCLTVQQYRARTALANFASPLGAGEAQFVSQQIQKRHVRTDFEIVLSAIDCRLDQNQFHEYILTTVVGEARLRPTSASFAVCLLTSDIPPALAERARRSPVPCIPSTNASR